MEPKRKLRKIWFNEEMDRDFQDIKNVFNTKFNIEPSNTEIQGFLLKIFKESQFQVKRKPKSKEFIFFR